jgi:NTE family protein
MSGIALALGGGGIKGIAHIGVLRCLEKEGIKIKAISGTSAGGIVGALFASGYDGYEIEDILNNMDQSRLFTRSSHDGPSLLGLQGLVQILSDLLGDKTFEELNIPFACTSVDIRSCQEIILREGKVTDAIQATVAVPGMFPPKEMEGALLVDGGVLDPVPVTLARYLAPTLPVVAVCLSAPSNDLARLQPFRMPAPQISIPMSILEQFSRFRVGQAFNIFVQSMDITSRMMSDLQLQLDPPEVIIRPDVESYSMLDKVEPKVLIELGYKAAENVLPEIHKMLSWQSKLSRQFRRGKVPGKILTLEDEEKISQGT